MPRPPLPCRAVLPAACAAALAGCQFDPAGAGGGGGSVDARPVGADAAAPDAMAALAVCPDDPDLIACLPFDGDAEDHSTHGHAGTIAGVAFADGVRGQALAAGEGVDVALAESALLDPATELTLDVWLMPGALPASGQRAGVIDNNGQWGLFVHPGGDVVCSVSSRSARATALLTVDEWRRVVCVYDGVELVIYEDGPRVVGATATGSINQAGNDGTTVGRNCPTGDYFTGRIDEVRIWRRAVPPATLCGSGGCGERN
jgi:hypothetical protein